MLTIWEIDQMPFALGGVSERLGFSENCPKKSSHSLRVWIGPTSAELRGGKGTLLSKPFLRLLEHSRCDPENYSNETWTDPGSIRAVNVKVGGCGLH